jgi:glycosyltransferase involved in cell wall biosynthesis
VRILFLNSIHLYGGGEVWMVTAARALGERGHAVTIVCRPDGAMRPFAEQAAARVVPLDIHGDFDPRVIWRTAGIIRRHDIDVILTNTDKELRFAGVAARLCHQPPVICRRGIDYPLKNTPGYRLTYNTLARCVVANSEATKQTLVGSVPWLDPDRVHVIHNGIDPDRYRPERTRCLRTELGIPPAARLAGFVGRLNEQKGIVYLLDAFARVAAQLADAQLLLVGDGDLRETVAAFARERGLEDRIHLAGFREDIPDVMRTVDVCVLPSLWEGFGIVLIEAMAAGKPCVTTRISSMPEIVQDGRTGLVVPPRDADSLAVALASLLQDPALAARQGAAGLAVVRERFTLARMIDRYEDVFRACL